MEMLNYCKNCVNAKKKRTDDKVWFCGKHRKVITEYTAFMNTGVHNCEDYKEERI